MKNKLITANLMLVLFGAGCGDTAYSPYGNAQNGTMPFNQGYPFNNQTQPMNQFQYQPNNWVMQNQNQLQNQLQWQMQTNQNQGCFPQQNPWGYNYYNPQRQYMVSWNMNLHSPGVYSTTTTRRSRSSTCYSTVPVYTYRSNKKVAITCLSCSDQNNSTTVSSSKSSNTTSGSALPVSNGNSTQSPGSKDIVEAVTFIWTGDDAKELYKRLNIEIKELPNRIDQKKGAHLHCENDKKLLGKDDYKCSLTVNKTDGVVYRQSEPGKKLESDKKGYFEPAAYDGVDVEIGANSDNDNAGLTFSGSEAKDIFTRMTASEVEGKHPVTNNEITSKTVGQLMCYKTKNTTRDNYYCEVKLHPSTGEVIDQGAAPSSSNNAKSTTASNTSTVTDTNTATNTDTNTATDTNTSTSTDSSTDSSTDTSTNTDVNK